MWSQDQLRARWEAGPPIEPAELVRDSGKQVWLASESDSEEEDDTVDLPAVDCGPFQPWAHRQAGELLVVGDNGGQWQWQTVTESDDEEVVAATKAQPAETWELAEPAVAEPTEPAQMSADDRMGGPNGPDAGHWPTARHPLPLQGRGGGMVAGCDKAREAVERWVDNLCPDVENTRRCTYMVNPCISLCTSSPNGGTCERMCARQ